MHFQLESTKTRTWAKKGRQPVVKSYAGRKSCAYGGFVNPETGELFVEQMSWFTYETTTQLLRNFVASRDGAKKIVIVMDNAPWHKKTRRLIRDDESYSDLKERIEFIDLPPYSPDLNPIEKV